MSRLEPVRRFPPTPEAVELVRVTLHRLGYPVAEADARTVAEAVLSLEGSRLLLLIRGGFENSLEIIRDTADAALGGSGKRVERSDLLAGGRRPIAPGRVEKPAQELDDDEPRPVFKRPRR